MSGGSYIGSGGVGGSGIAPSTDHGLLNGLSDDDHPRYYLRKVDVKSAATAGAGTSADPWTGWESVFSGLTVNTHFHFAEGYYRKTAATTLSDTYDIQITGAGEEATVIDNNADADCFTAAAGAPEAMITVRDLTITSTLAEASRTTGAAIRIDGPGRSRVHLCRLRLQKHYHGLHLSDVSNAHVEHVESVTLYGGDAFRVDGADPSTTVNFYSCYASGGRYGFILDSVVTATLTGCISEGGTSHRFYLTGGDNTVLTAPYTEALAAGADAFYLDSVSRITLIEPRCDATGRDALRFVGTAQACRAITVIGGALTGGTGYGANDVGLGTTEPITFIGTQLSGTSGAVADASANMTRISDHATGESIFAQPLSVKSGSSARTVPMSVLAAGSPAITAALAASTTRTPSATRPTLVSVFVHFNTSGVGASGSTTITADGQAREPIRYQNPLGAGTWNQSGYDSFILPPNTSWSFTQAGDAATVKAQEVIL